MVKTRKASTYNTHLHQFQTGHSSNAYKPRAATSESLSMGGRNIGS